MRRLVLVALAALAPFTLSCWVVRDILSDAIHDTVHETVSDAVRTGVRSFVESLTTLEDKCGELENAPVAIQEEVDLGGAVALNWVQNGGGLFYDMFDEDHAPASGDRAKAKNAVNLYVNRVGKNLAMQSSRPLLDWSFGVLDSPNFNAYSAPGGYVMVTRGLLREVKNEAELAGVLAHEIAHVTQRHALVAYRKVRLDQCHNAVSQARMNKVLGDVGQRLTEDVGRFGVDLHGVNAAPLLAAFTDTLVTLLQDQGFDQEQELEADRLAVELMVRAGYNPEAYIAFLGKIPRPSPGNVSHHPANEVRQQALRAYLEALGKDEFLVERGPLNKYPLVPLHGELAAAR